MYAQQSSMGPPIKTFDKLEQERKRRKNQVYMEAVRKMLDEEDGKRADQQRLTERWHGQLEHQHAASVQELPRDGVELSHRRRFEEAAARLPSFQLKHKEMPVAPHLKPFERAITRDSSVPLPRPVGGHSTVDLGGGGSIPAAGPGANHYETPVKNSYYCLLYTSDAADE